MQEEENSSSWNNFVVPKVKKQKTHVKKQKDAREIITTSRTEKFLQKQIAMKQSLAEKLQIIACGINSMRTAVTAINLLEVFGGELAYLPEMIAAKTQLANALSIMIEQKHKIQNIIEYKEAEEEAQQGSYSISYAKLTPKRKMVLISGPRCDSDNELETDQDSKVQKTRLSNQSD